MIDTATIGITLALNNRVSEASPVRWLERGIPDLAPCFAAFGRALDATPTQPAGYPTGSTEHDGWRFAEMGMHTG